MGELILCKNQMAAEPYFIEGAEIHLYSIEEVCWYILHNVYTADRDLMNYEFTDWTARLLGEPELAEKLEHIMQNGGTGYRFLMTILISAPGYCSSEELKETDKTLRELMDKSPFERAKTMADVDLRERRYIKAIASYRKLLKSEDADMQSNVTIGNIHNNLGVALCGMFLYREAAECFRRAYKLNDSMESKQSMELAYRLASGEEALSTPADGRASKALSKAAGAKKLNDEDAFFGSLTDYAVSLKEEYRMLSLG